MEYWAFVLEFLLELHLQMLWAILQALMELMWRMEYVIETTTKNNTPLLILFLQLLLNLLQNQKRSHSNINRMVKLERNVISTLAVPFKEYILWYLLSSSTFCWAFILSSSIFRFLHKMFNKRIFSSKTGAYNWWELNTTGKILVSFLIRHYILVTVILENQ